jgi:23S rRNA pseudouridine2605 synthase
MFRQKPNSGKAHVGTAAPGRPAAQRRTFFGSISLVSEHDSRKTGLARSLSKLGYCSRSQAAELIRAGRVSLNGKICRDPETPVHLTRDQIDVDGKPIGKPQKIYLMMNKTRGLVTTASDEKGRETVYSILENTNEPPPWVAPVGRLDKASEGLLLLTNDSEWAARIADPETHLGKTYHVQIARVADDELTQTLTQGIRTTNSDILRSRHVRTLRAGEKNCWLEIMLDEGKNRQIRRMFDALGIEVLRLVRVAIGPLQLGKLQKGTFRRLTDEEKHLLEREMIKRVTKQKASAAGNQTAPKRRKKRSRTSRKN